ITLITHIGFSSLLLVAFLPILGPLVRLVEKLMPDGAQTKAAPRYLDESALSTPTIALSAAARETLRLGDLVREMLEVSLSALKNADLGAREELAAIEKDIDRIHSAIKSYLSELGREELDD